MAIEIVKLTTTGSAGSAAASATISGLRGVLARLAINWHADAPAATTDITIVETWDGGSRTLYAKTNAVTDIDIVPQIAASDNAGTAITGAYGYIALTGGTITISIAQSDALTDCAIVTLVTVE